MQLLFCVANLVQQNNPCQEPDLRAAFLSEDNPVYVIEYAVVLDIGKASSSAEVDIKENTNSHPCYMNNCFDILIAVFGNW